MRETLITPDEAEWLLRCPDLGWQQKVRPELREKLIAITESEERPSGAGTGSVPPRELSVKQEWGTRLSRDRRAFVSMVADRAAAVAQVEKYEHSRDIVTRYAVAHASPDGSIDYAYTRWTIDPKDAR
jgi:hypothetical protein